MKIIEIYRGNGITELKAVGEDYEDVSENNDKGSGRLPFSAADLKDRHCGAVKGYYRGRGGITVLFDCLRDRGRKN